jgi:hypothetical protein
MHDDAAARENLHLALGYGLFAWLGGEFFVSWPFLYSWFVWLLALFASVLGGAIALSAVRRRPAFAIGAIGLNLCFWLLPYGPAFRDCFS